MSKTNEEISQAYRAASSKSEALCHAAFLKRAQTAETGTAQGIGYEDAWTRVDAAL